MDTRKRNQARLRVVVDNKHVSGGYKSGRRSCLDTPDAFSSGKTRSAGTRPDFLHFWSAWYRTPNFSAKGKSPPPSSIARSTGFMGATLQLKSVIRQQPSNVIGFDIMQLMVAKAKSDAIDRFCKNLNAEFDRIGAPVKGRPAWIVRELKERVDFKVTVTSCQKWLGVAPPHQIPRSSHLALICTAFEFNQQHLLTGKWEPAPGAGDPLFLEFQRAWGLIEREEERLHLVDTAKLLAGLKHKGDQSGRKPSKT